MSTKRFYDTARPLFGGKMAQSQVEGCNLILAECRRQRTNRQATAYILATALWETGRRMQPVREGFAKTDEDAIRIVTDLTKRRKIRNYAKPDPEHSYFGRGLVQITHRRNYEKAGENLGIDLVNKPDMALFPEVSAKILVQGMREGWFTGRSLDDVSEPETSGPPEFVNDRTVVNGKDRAAEIAQIADVFWAALEDVDLLSESRIVTAAKQTRKASTVGVILGAGTVVNQVIQAAAENPSEVIEAAQQGEALGRFLPWLGAGAATLMVALLIYQRVQANRAEKARREDNEVKGV